MDVRTFISAHGQFLRAFCVNSKIGNSFVLIGILSSSLVSAEALPIFVVQQQVNIQQNSVQSASTWQLQVLMSFLRLTMASSHLMTGFSSNSFLYMPLNDSTTATVGVTSYQLNSQSTPCYCLTLYDCSVPGAIYPTQQLPTFGQYYVETFGVGSVPVKGIQMGCFALESVLASTLECYYDSSCIGLFVSNPERFPPLQSSPSDQFPPNTTISNILQESMVENWTVSMSYDSYYAKCAPKTCSYSYNERNGFLIVFTTIFALIGGLNTVLRLLIPLIIQGIIRIIQRIKRQNNHVQRVVVVWTEQHSTPGNIIMKIFKILLNSLFFYHT